MKIFIVKHSIIRTTALFALVAIASCSVKNRADDNRIILKEIEKNDVTLRVDLTVSESKKLIAKGIANHTSVKENLKSGMVIITKGSTNTYIAEELIGGREGGISLLIAGNKTEVIKVQKLIESIQDEKPFV